MKTVRDVTPPLTETQIAKKLSSENLDELLQLWRTEQGVAKRRDLELMAVALPKSHSGHPRRNTRCPPTVPPPSRARVEWSDGCSSGPLPALFNFHCVAVD